MPVYEYRCRSCGRIHEIIQRHSDMPLSTCPSCGGEMKKLISNTSFVLKGTGWYKTDYASGSSSGAHKSGKKNGETSEKKDDAKPEGTKATTAEPASKS